jgi:small subunit ribosomal protein S3
MARVEKQMMGSIPLQTLQADVDYAHTTAVTTVGSIGIKVWIYRGMFGEQVETVAQPDRYRRRARR